MAKGREALPKLSRHLHSSCTGGSRPCCNTRMDRPVQLLLTHRCNHCCMPLSLWTVEEQHLRGSRGGEGGAPETACQRGSRKSLLAKSCRRYASTTLRRRRICCTQGESGTGNRRVLLYLSQRLIPAIWPWTP
ncbi:hypothetical protein cyc_02775 [Cyclospora cayetanensis]|uniref:Uncharacterized protein n=1 Tax=Cyclospora cayetanensis TaxID=88456 RepID=A0A1D3CTW2_9EIME|nr:hypothetical protein cyc_02775 [Cyclospora cayetanensis]